jgi:hypothetical protein
MCQRPPATGMITLRGDLADAGVQKAVKSVMGAGRACDIGRDGRRCGPNPVDVAR